MATSLPRGTDLYHALLDEGFQLPDDCGDIWLQMPVDGILRLHFTILISGDNLVKLGRALAKLGEQRGETAVLNEQRDAAYRFPPEPNWKGE
jgi:hypothetical protein